MTAQSKYFKISMEWKHSSIRNVAEQISVLETKRRDFIANRFSIYQWKIRIYHQSLELKIGSDFSNERNFVQSSFWYERRFERFEKTNVRVNAKRSSKVQEANKGLIQRIYSKPEEMLFWRRTKSRNASKSKQSDSRRI